MIDIQIASDADIPEVKNLFREYAVWVGVDLSFQGFDDELEGLPGDYAQPTGVLFVARVDGRVAGCVAAHQWSPATCEMKRLFVRDSFRSFGCGRVLVESIITWARESGFKRVLLDTLPSMGRAQHLYLRLGFREIAPYRPNPVPGARFLELSLE